VQAGPGFPMIPEATAMGKMLGLEQNSLVAYWDQRGCGKSYDKNIDPQTINFKQLTADIISCTTYLLNEYQQQKAILIGYSIGATSGLMAAMQNSRLFSQLFLVGIDVNLPDAGMHTQYFMEQEAKKSANKKRMQQVDQLNSAPVLKAKAFQQRAKLLTDMGGINTHAGYNQMLFTSIKNMVFSKDYNLSDIPKTIKGMEFCQNALLPELDKLNLFNTVKKVDVPVHFIQGKKDAVAPYDIATSYYNYLQAPDKSFTSFEHSAHMPHYEEPGKFAGLIKEKLADVAYGLTA
jgi:pimeloyl-ACP methyl ester carboxylesterase